MFIVDERVSLNHHPFKRCINHMKFINTFSCNISGMFMDDFGVFLTESVKE